MRIIPTIKSFLASGIPASQAVKILTDARTTNDFFDEKELELTELYPEEWVAVFMEDIVAHNKDHDALLREIRTKDVPTNRGLVVRFLTKDNPITILSSA